MSEQQTTPTPSKIPCPIGCTHECLPDCDAWASRLAWDAAGRPKEWDGRPWAKKQEQPNAE